MGKIIPWVLAFVAASVAVLEFFFIAWQADRLAAATRLGKQWEAECMTSDMHRTPCVWAASSLPSQISPD